MLASDQGFQRRFGQRRSNLDHLPESFAEVLAAMFAFADLLLSGTSTAAEWNPDSEAWE